MCLMDPVVHRRCYVGASSTQGHKQPRQRERCRFVSEYERLSGFCIVHRLAPVLASKCMEHDMKHKPTTFILLSSASCLLVRSNYSHSSNQVAVGTLCLDYHKKLNSRHLDYPLMPTNLKHSADLNNEVSILTTG